MLIGCFFYLSIMKKYIFLLLLIASFNILFVPLSYAKNPFLIVVAKDGSGDYSSVQLAINAVEDYQKKTTVIFIKKGIYKEKLTVPFSKQHLLMVGQSADSTIICFDDFASRKNASGFPMGTRATASCFVYASDFSASHLTFSNTAGPVGQAVAICTLGDRLCFYDCHFLGFQDTIFTDGHPSRQYFNHCYIEGTVDFIFGPSTVIFDSCRIFCKNHGYVSAASTRPETKYGYVFRDCVIYGDKDAKSTHFLGRPWRPFAKVVFIRCDLSEVIRPEGWSKWKNSDTAAVTAYFAEGADFGPGANANSRVPWSHQLDHNMLSAYSTEHIFEGWLPLDLRKLSAEIFNELKISINE